MTFEESSTIVTHHKILLADDSVSIRKVVELTFADEGFDVTAVGDGDAAMQKFVEIQPDLVLVDVNLPGPSGYQICEMIKQDESTKSIPVVLLVGSFEPFDQTEAERVGADGFLTKPFQSIRELVSKVDELLGIDNPERAVIADTEDIDNLYVSSFAETIRVDDNLTANEYLSNGGMDDEMIEASYPADVPADAGTAFFVPGMEEREQVDPFDTLADTIDISIGKAGDEPPFEPRFVFDDAEPFPRFEDEETVSNEDTIHDEPVAETRDAVTKNISPELIALIAQKVVEKLSDKVVREIARDAVPRIAEKLIREALEEDNKG